MTSTSRESGRRDALRPDAASRARPGRTTPTEWCALVVGLAGVLWYAWLLDDAYVYFRYVDQWVLHGAGICWNPGESVEGYSSPAWLLWLATWRAAGLDYWWIVRLTGLASFVVFWRAACALNRAWIGDRAGARSVDLPVLFLSCQYGVLAYFTSGLETPFVILAAAAFALAVARPAERWCGVAVGLTPLVRHEFLLPFAAYCLWSILARRRRPTAALLTCAATSGAYLVFRVWYFADLVPNTFHLKDETSVGQGLYYLYDALMPYWYVPYFLAVVVWYGALRSSGAQGLRGGDRLLLLLLAGLVAAYVTRIGGDARHMRYLLFSCVLAVLATGGVLELWLERAGDVARRAAAPLALALAVGVGAAYPHQLTLHPALHGALGGRSRMVHGVTDSAGFRHATARTTPPWYAWSTPLSVAEARERHARGVAGIEPPYHPRLGIPNWRVRRDARDGHGVFADGWCQNSYLRPASPVVHKWALTDAFLAHANCPSDRPGHKEAVTPMAEELLDLRARYGFGPGAFRRAVEDERAPAWVARNLETLERLEERVYNRRDFATNLALSLDRPPRYDP